MTIVVYPDKSILEDIKTLYYHLKLIKVMNMHTVPFTLKKLEKDGTEFG